MPDTIIAYHFLRSDFTTGSGDEKPWEIGEARTIAHPKRIQLCKYGYHSSPSLWDALQYAPGALACLVEISTPLFKDNDKQVSLSRHLVRAVNIDRELLLFACDCADHVLYIFESHYPDDKRLRLAIEIRRAFVDGKATQTQLVAARKAAVAAVRDAARDATWDAARAAAWDAAQTAVWDAAWDAARDATWDAAQAAAWDAVWKAVEAAVWDAAQAAAWDAARDAEVNWQRQRWDEYFGDLFNA